MSEDYLNQRQDEEVKNQIDNSQSSLFIPFAAGIGAIGLGASIFKSRLAAGGGLIANLLHFLGHPQGVGIGIDSAANVGTAATRSRTAGLRSVLTGSTNIRGQLNLGPVDLIDDARSALDVINATPRDQARRLTTHFQNYVNNRFSSKVSDGFFTHGLQRVTAGEVISNQGWRTLLGQNQWEVIYRARRAGLFTDSTVIDNAIYTAPNGAIRDLRITSLFTRPVQLAARPGESAGAMGRAPLLDLFGQARVIGGILGERRGFAVLAPDRSFSGTRFFIDGNIYGYQKVGNTLNEHLLATNRTLQQVGSPLIPVQEAREGTLTLRIKQRSGPVGQAISAFEAATGVGRSFSARPSLVERWIIDPIKRYTSLLSGDGVVYRHQNKYSTPFGRAADAALGGDMPEAVFNHGVITPVQNGGRSVPVGELSFTQRLAVLFDLSDEYSVVKTPAYNIMESGGRNLNNADLIVPRRDKGYIHRRTNFPNASIASQLSDVQQRGINSVGAMSESLQAKYLDVPKSSFANEFFPGLTSLKTLANYSIYRTSSLASESLLGIAFAPAKTLAGNLARMAAIPLLYDAGKEAAGYADFLMEEYLGFSPIKTAADMYAGLRVKQQEIRSGLGIQQAAKSMDENFPGSVKSEGSTFLRSVGAPLGAMAALMGKIGLGKAAGVAAAIFAAIGGPDPSQTAEELKDEYLGETKVPVRKGAFWGMGYLPFFGGEVDHYDFSWYHKLQTDYQTKAMYGSRSEYYQYHANVLGVPLPTPHSLFGVKNILNPYRFEELHYRDRPYQTTGSQLEEFPIVGPLLSATIGRLIKPKMNRQMDMPLLQAGLVQRGLDPGTAEALGMSKLDVSDAQIVDPHNALYRLNKFANIASEPLGVYKFVMEFFGVKISPPKDPTLASSDIATAKGRELYESGIGGAFGQTEFLRRFFVSDYYSPHKKASLVNNIRNNMPDWLPGLGSANQKDQAYSTDFTMGDPYVKIANGEARLPGAGYEALNRLHSGTPGVYDEVDQFKILADVAPYSAQYRTLEKKVMSMNLDPYWAKQVQNAAKYKADATSVDKRYLRYGESLSDLNQGIKDSAIYKMARGAYDTFTHDFLAEIPYIGSKLFPFRNPYEQYRKLQVEGSAFASWDTPWEGIIRPMITDMASVNPFMAAVKGASIGGLLAGPMQMFNPAINSVGARGLIGGGIGLGAGLSIGRIAAGYDQDYIPGYKEQESNTTMYMDAINYLKYRALSEAASESGSPLAGPLGNMVNRTMLGANNEMMLRASLPTSADKKYFDYFMSSPLSNRSQIYNGVPGYMKEALAKGWEHRTYSRDQADARAAQMLGDIPAEDWVGWNPDMPIVGTKIHLINHGINGVAENYHRFGFYESQENAILNRMPTFNDNSVQYNTLPVSAQFTDILAIQKKAYLKQFGGSSAMSQTNFTANRMNRKFTIGIDRRADTIETVKQYARSN